MESSSSGVFGNGLSMSIGDVFEDDDVFVVLVVFVDDVDIDPDRDDDVVE